MGQWNGDVSVRESLKKPIPLFSISGGVNCMTATDEVVVIGSVDGDMRIVRMDTPLSENAPTDDLHRTTSFGDWLVPREGRRWMRQPIYFNDGMGMGMDMGMGYGRHVQWGNLPVLPRCSDALRERKIFF